MWADFHIKEKKSSGNKRLAEEQNRDHGLSTGKRSQGAEELRDPGDDITGGVSGTPWLLRRKHGLGGELWGSGNVGIPRSSLINPKLAPGRVRINSRFKDLPRQLKGLSKTNYENTWPVQTSSSYKAGPGARSRGSWWRKKVVGQGGDNAKGWPGWKAGYLPVSCWHFPKGTLNTNFKDAILSF